MQWLDQVLYNVAPPVPVITEECPQRNQLSIVRGDPQETLDIPQHACFEQSGGDYYHRTVTLFA